MTNEEIKGHLTQTTISYPRWLQNVKEGKYNPKDGSGTHWGIALNALSSPQPSTAVVSGVGLYRLGGTLESETSHLDDGTYQLVIGDWADAAILAKLNIPETYAYTVTTKGVPSGRENEWVILDANPNGGTIPFSLPPIQYANKCVEYVKSHPGLDGIFLDNLLSEIPGILDAIRTVSAIFKQNNVKWGANVGSYISGDERSNGGVLWREFAITLDPYLNRMMLENWQQPSSQDGVSPPATGLRKTGPEWYNQWNEWQLCVGVVPGKFLPITYSYGNPEWANYGRASMLLGPNAHPGNVYCTALENSRSDPYNSTWTKKDPHPTINPNIGKATL